MQTHPSTLWRRTFLAAAPGLAAALVASLGISLLMLAVPLYSLQLFDRVLSSGHLETLLLLTLILAFTLLVLAGLDAVRTSLLARIGTRFAAALERPLLEACLAAGLAGRNLAGQHFRDLATVRQTIAGPAVNALFEAPWLPLAVAAIWFLHPDLGLFAIGGAVLLWLVALLNEALTGTALARAQSLALDTQTQAEALARRADAVQAMGMLPTLASAFTAASAAALGLQQQAAERSGVLMGLTRALRLLAQAGVMGLGAWLVITHELTPGGMMAASILLGRALAPVEQLLGAWRQLAAARLGARRLEQMLAETADRPLPMALPVPAGRLTIESVTVANPASGRPILNRVAFALEPGTLLAVIGPSAAGKSTLCRLLAGCIRASHGTARLDGADLSRLPRAAIGPHIGYLPQDPSLFAGTIAQNIARMAATPDAEAVVEAAKLAGVHELILRLPEGYDTRLGDGGAPLSAGQRQRVALARALYGEPCLVVLDEPNASLDAAGEQALHEALKVLKTRGTTVVMVTHRPHVLQLADLLLVLEDGVVTRFGPREQVIAKLVRPTARAA
jgi:ATP-binding cassette subfamily C exporter for protease/lipase